MGWNVGWKSRDALIGHVTSPSHFSVGYELVNTRIVGNNVWSLVRRPDGSTLISLDLVRAFREKGQSTEWGYKGLDECSGPCEVNSFTVERCRCTAEPACCQLASASPRLSCKAQGTSGLFRWTVPLLR